MGADTSLPLPAVKPNFSMMSVTFHDSDRITILHLDSFKLSQVEQVINKTWSRGIQKQESCCGTGWSFKLIGNPFRPSEDVIIVKETHCMVMGILQELQRIGYQIVESGCCGSRTDRSTLFFKAAPSTELKPLCVGFIGSDKIQFTHLPAELKHPIKDIVRTHWKLGIQMIDSESDILRLKLAGNPWSATNNKDSIMAKVLLKEVFAELYRHGWFHLVNVKINGDADCLVFYQDVNLNTFVDSEFCVISFGQGDRLRLISLPDDVNAKIRTVIKANWIPGQIQHEGEFHRSYEFKLSGFPWNSRGKESVKARHLMTKIFQQMSRHGWYNVASCYFNCISSDRVALVFQKREPMDPPIFCIAPHNKDGIWLIDMPTNLVNLIKSILLSRWSQGIQQVEKLAMHFGDVVHLNLYGLPWVGGENNSSIHARSVLCSVIDEFYQEGWELMRCANITSGIVVDYDIPFDVDSFWFVYNPTHLMVQPSAPRSELPPTYSKYESASYPPTVADYGNLPSPHFHEPPLSYEEATGWTEQR